MDIFLHIGFKVSPVLSKAPSNCFALGTQNDGGPSPLDHESWQQAAGEQMKKTASGKEFVCKWCEK